LLLEVVTSTVGVVVIFLADPMSARPAMMSERIWKVVAEVMTFRSTQSDGNVEKWISEKELGLAKGKTSAVNVG